MKLCPPVDFKFTILQSLTPFLHCMARNVQGIRVLSKAHSAPVQRLQMHRPEGLNGPALHVRARAEPQAFLLSHAALFEVFQRLFPAEFGLIFLMFSRFFPAHQIDHPARKCAPVQIVIAAVSRAGKPALTPGLDVHAPIGPVRLVLKMFQIHHWTPQGKGTRHAVLLQPQIDVQDSDGYDGEFDCKIKAHGAKEGLVPCLHIDFYGSTPQDAALRSDAIPNGDNRLAWFHTHNEARFPPDRPE